MQGLKVLATIVDEIARVNEIVDGQTHRKPDTYVAPCQQVQQKAAIFTLSSWTDRSEQTV